MDNKIDTKMPTTENKKSKKLAPEISLVSRLISFGYNKITSEQTKVVLGSSVVFGSVFALMLAIAILLYLIIYWSVMPEMVQSITLNLDYTNPLLPTASLNCHETGLLKASSQYDLSLSLTIPESFDNLRIGNFMVSVDLVRSKKLSLSKPVLLTDIRCM